MQNTKTKKSFKEEILTRIQANQELKTNSVAILDLDGTLFDVTYRTFEILKRFIEQKDIQEHFSEQTKLCKKLEPKNFLYSLESTLNHIGIERYSEHSAQFIHLANDYWFKHFFTDPLLAYDQAYPGAQSCIDFLYQNNVHLVYLSGRDIPNMSKGTIEALESAGFPHTGERITMCLKPNYGMDDLNFKTQSLNLINTVGNVICTFDNEPANVDLFIRRFPDAINVHFHSQHARDIQLSGESLRIIKSFSEFDFH